MKTKLKEILLDDGKYLVVNIFADFMQREVSIKDKKVHCGDFVYEQNDFFKTNKVLKNFKL